MQDIHHTHLPREKAFGTLPFKPPHREWVWKGQPADRGWNLHRACWRIMTMCLHFPSKQLFQTSFHPRALQPGKIRPWLAKLPSHLRTQQNSVDETKDFVFYGCFMVFKIYPSTLSLPEMKLPKWVHHTLCEKRVMEIALHFTVKRWKIVIHSNIEDSNIMWTSVINMGSFFLCGITTQLPNSNSINFIN